MRGLRCRVPLSKLFCVLIIVLVLCYFSTLYNISIHFERRDHPIEILEVLRNRKVTETTQHTKVDDVPTDIISPLGDAQCVPTPHVNFPLCAEKYEYVKGFYSAISCFDKDHHNLDGTDCSVYRYLTEVEPFCAKHNKKPVQGEYINSLEQSIDKLLVHLPESPYRWMKERAKQTWLDWQLAGKQFLNQKQKWKKQKVLCYLGSMGFQPMILEYAGKGAPLGELVQWTDLISGLVLLKYDITVVLNSTQLTPYIDKDDKNGCALNTNKKHFDVIFTDINGVSILFNEFGYSSTAKYRCKIRVLDSFGTFVEYNYPNFPHKIPGGVSYWGNINLLPVQYLTLLPHTPDNSFLGFVVGNLKANETKRSKKKHTALIYAKLLSYLSGRIPYLEVISEYFDIHATLVIDSDLAIPDFIKNHGPVSGKKIKELLTEAKLFIGVGFPFEGPGPLEAMATGTTFLQPKFDEPVNKLNSDFFKDKPTLRKLSSQSPYMEEMIGEPYCYTIDVNNHALLRETLQKIKRMEDLPPKIPSDFSNYGMLERIHIFTEHMDLCDAGAPRWPPISHLKVELSERAQSCKEACQQKGLVCERSFFPDINSVDSMKRYAGLECKTVKHTLHLHPPSYDSLTRICHLQRQGQTYSCMHAEDNLKRLCPCRDYVQGQIQLCHDCL